MALFFNGLYYLVVSYDLFQIESLYGNDQAFQVSLTVASLAVMLCIAYFQYLIQKQTNEKNDSDVLAQSILDISKFDCSCALYNFNIDSCRFIYYNKFEGVQGALFELRFTDSCMKNYINILKVDAKIYNDKNELCWSKNNIQNTDFSINIFLRGTTDSPSSSFVNSFLLAPYHTPFSKDDIYILDLFIKFRDQRYINKKNDEDHTFKLTIRFAFDKYNQYGLSKARIVSRKIKLLN